MNPFDLCIVGGGPAGLSAAINAASEGLSVRLLDNGSMLGGQARESAAIENYPGFPDGVTGKTLMTLLTQQAEKFGTDFYCPESVLDLAVGADSNPVLTTGDYHEHPCRAVLLTLGLQYRRLNARNASQFLGRGVYYGIPGGKPERSARQVAIVGGANSAGQAALNLARNPRTSVTMLVRKGLRDKMSQYLVDRIEAADNIEVREHCEVQACYGKHSLQEIGFVDHGAEHTLPVSAMHIFIGAIPRTMWLKDTLTLDKDRYIQTGFGGFTYQTSMPGVFAAGDVRSGSTKRISTASGEGIAAIQEIHRYLGD